jgi:ABC-type glycerol-3-phosphate transport system substrate-binding protein
MRSASIALTAMLVAGLATPVFADTNISIVHVQESAVARALWDRIAKDYEVDHKGVTVQFEYIQGKPTKRSFQQCCNLNRDQPLYTAGVGV